MGQCIGIRPLLFCPGVLLPLLLLTLRFLESGIQLFVLPKKLLKLSPDKLNEKGYHPVMITDVNACVACGSCFRTCPDTVISIVKE